MSYVLRRGVKWTREFPVTCFHVAISVSRDVFFSVYFSLGGHIGIVFSLAQMRETHLRDLLRPLSISQTVSRRQRETFLFRQDLPFLV